MQTARRVWRHRLVVGRGTVEREGWTAAYRELAALALRAAEAHGFRATLEACSWTQLRLNAAGQPALPQELDHFAAWLLIVELPVTDALEEALTR